MTKIDKLLEQLRSQNVEINEGRLQKSLRFIDEVEAPPDLRENAREFVKLMELHQTLETYGLIDQNGELIVKRFPIAQIESAEERTNSLRPPFNAEYLLYFLLRREERDAVIGDLNECYETVCRLFNKRHADIWFYKQVVWSVFPLLRRGVLRIGAFVWLGRILRRLIS
jgi:hypothetical protein